MSEIQNVDSSSEPWDLQEYVLPMILIAVGFGAFAAYGYLAGGAAQVGDILAHIGNVVAVRTISGIVGCFIVSWIFGISYGYLSSAILKIAAILIFPSVVFLILPWWLAFLCSYIIYFGLIKYLFDLEWVDVLWTSFAVSGATLLR